MIYVDDISLNVVCGCSLDGQQLGISPAALQCSPLLCVLLYLCLYMFHFLLIGGKYQCRVRAKIAQEPDWYEWDYAIVSEVFIMAPTPPEPPLRIRPIILKSLLTAEQEQTILALTMPTDSKNFVPMEMSERERDMSGARYNNNTTAAAVAGKSNSNFAAPDSSGYNLSHSNQYNPHHQQGGQQSGYILGSQSHGSPGKQHGHSDNYAHQHMFGHEGETDDDSIQAENNLARRKNAYLIQQMDKYRLNAKLQGIGVSSSDADDSVPSRSRINSLDNIINTTTMTRTRTVSADLAGMVPLREVPLKEDDHSSVEDAKFIHNDSNSSMDSQQQEAYDFATTLYKSIAHATANNNNHLLYDLELLKQKQQHDTFTDMLGGAGGGSTTEGSQELFTYTGAAAAGSGGAAGEFRGGGGVMASSNNNNTMRLATDTNISLGNYSSMLESTNDAVQKSILSGHRVSHEDTERMVHDYYDITHNSIGKLLLCYVLWCVAVMVAVIAVFSVYKPVFLLACVFRICYIPTTS